MSETCEIHGTALRAEILTGLRYCEECRAKVNRWFYNQAMDELLRPRERLEPRPGQVTIPLRPIRD